MGPRSKKTLPPSPTPVDDDRPCVKARRRATRTIATAPHRHRVILPNFKAAEPQLWFWRAEAIFCREGVSNSQQRYDHILPRLSDDLLVTVLDLVESLEENLAHPYKQL